MSYHGAFPLAVNKPKLKQLDFAVVAGLVPADATAARVASSSKSEEGMAGDLGVDLNANNRQPVYRDPSLRLVSRPNGPWRVERRVTERGTREWDNWEPISRATTKEAAIQRMLNSEGAAV
jgi:hypothetical protein